MRPGKDYNRNGRLHGLVVGAGGFGSKVASSVSPIKDLLTICVDTDVDTLEKLASGKRFLISTIDHDHELVDIFFPSWSIIDQHIEHADFVFIVGGAAGSTTNKIARRVAQCARKHRAILTLGIMSLPLQTESLEIEQKAIRNLKSLKKELDSIIVFPTALHQRINYYYSKTIDPLTKKFYLKSIYPTARRDEQKFRLEMIEKMSQIPYELWESWMVPSSSRLDLLDSVQIARHAGYADVWSGRSSARRKRDRIDESFHTAFKDMYFCRIGHEKLKGIYIIFTGPTDISLKEVSERIEFYRRRFRAEKRIAFSLRHSKNTDKTIKVTVIGFGTKTLPYIYEFRAYETTSHLHKKYNRIKLPDLIIPHGFFVKSYFEHIARKGMKKQLSRFYNIDNIEYAPTYHKRLNKELDIIDRLDYESTFLFYLAPREPSKRTNGTQGAAPRFCRRVTGRLCSEYYGHRSNSASSFV